MEKFIIKGGSKLSGKIKIESAKNAVLPMMAGALLTKEQVIIKNCPKIHDVLNLILILESLGVTINFQGNDLIINAKEIKSYDVPEFLMKELRSSIFVVGALLGRINVAKFSFPGGCNFGERPINYHLDGFKKLGINCNNEGNDFFCEGKPIANSVYLPYPSVGATENLILTAVKAKGITKIFNAALEPEITDLVSLLNSMGAKIYGGGTDCLQIEGVSELHGTVYKPIADRIETGTYIIATLIAGGEVELQNANTENILFLTNKLCDYTCNVDRKNDIIKIKSVGKLCGFDFTTGPYPSFPTDMQAQTVALLSVSKGVSYVKETVFKKRFGYIKNLVKMGADINLQEDGLVTVRGVKALHGNVMKATDLRGGAAVCLAALCAEGISCICDAEHIDRGYAMFCEKLKALGVDIKRVCQVGYNEG